MEYYVKSVFIGEDVDFISKISEISDIIGDGVSELHMVDNELLDMFKHKGVNEADIYNIIYKDVPIKCIVCKSGEVLLVMQGPIIKLTMDELNDFERAIEYRMGYSNISAKFKAMNDFILAD